VVYPVGRGSAVAFTAFFDVLFLGRYLGQPPVTPLGWLGIAGVVLGVALIGFRVSATSIAASEAALASSAGDDKEKPKQKDEEKEEGVIQTGSISLAVLSYEGSGHPSHGKVLAWALLLGLLIAMYTAVDVIGLRYWDVFSFLWVNYFSSATFGLPILWQRKDEATQVWRDHRSSVLLIGIASPSTHWVVLWALAGGQTAYIVAIREIGIVVAALLGFAILREEVTMQKLTGISIIVAAIVAIKLA